MAYIFEELVDRIYSQFGLPTTFVGVHRESLAASAQPAHLIDENRRRTLLSKVSEPESDRIHAAARELDGTGEVPANPESGTFRRIVVPMRAQGIVVGWLFLVDKEGGFDPSLLTPLQPMFDAAALHAYLEEGLRHRTWTAVSALLSSDEDRSRAASELLVETGVPRRNTSLRVVVIDDAEEPALSSAMRYHLAFGLRSAFGEAAGRTVVLLADGDPSPTAQAERRLRDALETLEAPHSIRAGFGMAVSGYADAKKSYRTALAALRFARSIASESSVANWDDLKSWRTLLSLAEDEAEASLDPRVAAFIARSSAADLALVSDYLHARVDVTRIAEAHSMHRTTLYSRLHRMQSSFGLDWSDPEDRLATVLGVRVSQLRPSAEAG